MDHAKTLKLTRRSFFGAACLCCMLPRRLFADAPMVKRQAPGFYRLMVGDFEVTALSDGASPMPAMKLLQGDRIRIIEDLRRNYLAPNVETSHNSFLVNSGAKLVLIDAGAGTLLGPHTGQLISNLRAAGYWPEQVDEIYLTHMHADHIGGLMSGNERTFANATVRVDKREIDYWLCEANARIAPEDAKRFFQAATVSITPYMQAGKLLPFEGDTELVPGVSSQTAYGHTPGHTMYMVESKGEKLLLWGDVVHVAAVQFDDPTVTIQYDVNPSQAEQVHESAFADAAAKGYMVGGAHVSFPGLGHVRRDGEKAYAFVPLNYSAGIAG